MRSLWNDLTIMVDAETVQVYRHAPDILQATDGLRGNIRHEGQPVEAITQILTEAVKTTPAFRNRLHVVIGRPWSHAAVLPWQDGLFTDSAWAAYAHALLCAPTSKIDWEIQVEFGTYGKNRLAAAICPALFAALNALSQATGWRLTSLRDALSAALARHAGVMDTRSWCFLLAEPQVISCLYRHNDAWSDLVTLPRTPHGVEAWIAMAALLSGQTMPHQTYLCGADIPESAVGLEGVVLLDHWSPQPAADSVAGEET